ncbi:MAG: bifunctional phosphoglucose/phosphomannose isomerase [Candidatus Aenigmarchaeota archaeon]
MADVDKSNLKQVLKDYPKQFKKGLGIAENVKAEGSFDRVIVSGMGGSALPAELLGVYLEGEVLVIINRDYTLPPLLASDLVFISSYSGNTEETLGSFGDGEIHGAQMVGFSAGGTLKGWCKDKEVPHVKYPADGPDFQPRCATGYAFSAMVKVLSNSGVIEERDAEITAVGEYLEGLSLDGQAKGLAAKLKGKIPIVYSSGRMSILARMWKIKFNENVKIPSFYNTLPELNHNELSSYESPLKDYHFIIIRDPEDHERTRKRMELTADLIEQQGGNATIVEMEGPSLLARLFGTVYLGDWVSYYLALEEGTDPTPVRMQEEFKKRLLE